MVWPVLNDPLLTSVTSLRFDSSPEPAILARRSVGGIVRVSLSTGKVELVWCGAAAAANPDLGWGVLPDGRLLSLRSPLHWRPQESGIWLFPARGAGEQIFPSSSVQIDANGGRWERTIRGLAVGPKGDVFVLRVAEKEGQPSDTIDEIYKLTENAAGGNKREWEWKLTKVAGGGPHELPVDQPMPALEVKITGVQHDPNKFSTTHDGGFLFSRSDSDIVRATPLADGTFELKAAVVSVPHSGTLLDRPDLRLLAFNEAFDGSIIAWARLTGLLSNGRLFISVLNLELPRLAELSSRPSKVITGQGNQVFADSILDRLDRPRWAASHYFPALADPPAFLPAPDGGIFTVRQHWRSDGTGLAFEGGELLLIDDGDSGSFAVDMYEAARQSGRQDPGPANSLRDRLKRIRERALLSSKRLPLESDKDAELRQRQSRASGSSSEPLKFVELANQIRHDNHFGKCTSRSFLAILPAELTDELARYNIKHCRDGWWEALNATITLNLFNEALASGKYGDCWAAPALRP